MEDKTKLNTVDEILLKVMAGILLLLLVYINLMSGLRNNRSIVSITLTSLHDLGYLFSILLYFRYPILTMLLTFMSQWFLILEDCIQGDSLLTALSNCGIVEVLIWCTIPIVVVYTIKHADTNGLKFKDKFASVLLAEEEPIRLKWWQQFIILCLSTTVILNVINKYTLGFESNQTLAKILSTIVIVLATLTTVLRFIRFSVFYKIIIVLEITKIVSLFTVVKDTEIHTEDIMYISIETLVIIYAIYLYYRYRNSSKNEELDEDGTKVSQVERES